MTSPKVIGNSGLFVCQFLMPKSGNEPEECEDAIGINTERGRFAVADGATEAFDAGHWASRLAHHWVSLDSCLTRTEFGAWLREEGEALHESWSGLKLPWYSEEKAREGSFAAFVGVQVETAENRWRAIALGDCCLIHSRDGKALKGLPINSSQDFCTAPVLAASHSGTQLLATDKVSIDSNQTERGDVILLLSDALAAWYLKLLETGDTESESYFRTKLTAGDRERLVKLFEIERESGKLKNDDLAAILIGSS